MKKADSKLAEDFKVGVFADLRKRFFFNGYDELEMREVCVAHITSFLDRCFKQLNCEEFKEFR